MPLPSGLHQAQMRPRSTPEGGGDQAMMGSRARRRPILIAPFSIARCGDGLLLIWWDIGEVRFLHSVVIGRPSEEVFG